MNIFGIGLPEMAVIAAIGLLVFGPKRLPELGKTLGRTLRGFQSASQEFEQEFRSAIASSEASTPSAAAAAGLSAAAAPPAEVALSGGTPAPEVSFVAATTHVVTDQVVTDQAVTVQAVTALAEVSSPADESTAPDTGSLVEIGSRSGDSVG